MIAVKKDAQNCLSCTGICNHLVNKKNELAMVSKIKDLRAGIYVSFSVCCFLVLNYNTIQ